MSVRKVTPKCATVYNNLFNFPTVLTFLSPVFFFRLKKEDTEENFEGETEGDRNCDTQGNNLNEERTDEYETQVHI